MGSFSYTIKTPLGRAKNFESAYGKAQVQRFQHSTPDRPCGHANARGAL